MKPLTPVKPKPVGMPVPMPGPALSILPQPPTPQAILSGVQTPVAPPVQAEMREFGDAKTTRRFIYEDALKAAQELEAIEDDNYSLRLTDVDWHDPERFKKRDRKKAVLTGETLGRRMHGTWEMHDKKTGQLVQKRKQIIGSVPYLSSMGTFTHRGNEYTVNHQQRLKPGVFARLKDNGELESHFNIMPGKGVSHRYFMDPENGVFKMKFGQSEMPLMPLIRAMGATDREIRDAWGDQLWQTNYGKNDTNVLRKLAQKMLRKKDLEGADEGSATAKLVARFNAMELDPTVTKRTLGHPYDRVTKEAILAATSKLLKVSKKEADPDDRDHLAYQQFLGPEDLFAERLRRDHSGIRRGIFKKLALANGDLSKMPSGALTPQLEQVLLGSGLAQALEEINPSEVFDKQSRITRLGEGGIPSVDSIPDEARSVQPSHMGFMDPLRTPESFRVGVDVQMSRGARKGKDGRIYTRFRDLDSGEMVWKSPQDVADLAVAFPGALNLPADRTLPAGFRYSALAATRRIAAGRGTPQDQATVDAYRKASAGAAKRVPVMKGGKITYVPRGEVDLELPSFEDAFSPLGNLVPLKSMVKGQRVAMASRMLTQALPLQGAEAPLVQGAVPGGGGNTSFEEEYGPHMGAVRADKAGRVASVADGVMHLKYDDGTGEEVELYEHFPFNRKTYIHQQPVVKPGDSFKPGQLLVRSNYTDGNGATALGLNARVAYMPWKGYNFEDALVISESMAKRMSSEHMYQHDVEVDERTKVGRKAFVSLFPQKFDRLTLSKMDDDGVIKPGEEVEYGQPLILAARERDRAQNKVHKQRQAGFNDTTVLWKHHDRGIVTDVVRGPKGPVVLVKSVSGMQVGDKMSGRYGDKGVIAAIVPDHQMPHGQDGKPYEVLLNPLGVISRTNPAQKVEAMLGKIAALTGKPYKVSDFDSVEDMTEFAEKELAKHGLKDLEDVVDPESGRRVKGVATGNRFFMKLHHTAESKGQGRGSGGYGLDETPSKGGETGCLVGDTLLRCFGPLGTGNIDIGTVVRDRLDLELPSGRVTDFFEYAVPSGEVIELELENGAVVALTRNHKMYRSDGTVVLAGDLVEGDDLMEG